MAFSPIGVVSSGRVLDFDLPALTKRWQRSQIWQAFKVNTCSVQDIFDVNTLRSDFRFSGLRSPVAAYTWRTEDAVAKSHVTLSIRANSDCSRINADWRVAAEDPKAGKLPLCIRKTTIKSTHENALSE
jgi:hypothetical protein